VKIKGEAVPTFIEHRQGNSPLEGQALSRSEEGDLAGAQPLVKDKTAGRKRKSEGEENLVGRLT